MSSRSAAGTFLGPASWGCLAALGMTEVPVRARLRVLLVTTGDEVVEPGRPLGPGKIYDSNGTLLEAALRQAGLEVNGRVSPRTGRTSSPHCCAGMPRLWT